MWAGGSPVEDFPPMSRRPSAPRRSSRAPTTPVAVLLVVTAALALANGAIFALLAELQDRYGFATWGLGLIAGAAFAAGLVANLTIARYADRGRARELLLVGLALAVVGTAWMGLASELWAFTASRLLLGLGYGAFVPAARKVIIATDPPRAGALLGRLAAAGVAGFTLGPPLAAAITEVAGPRAPFLALAAVVAGCVPAIARTPVPVVVAAPQPRVVRGLLAEPAVQAPLAVGAALYLSIGLFEAVWARYLTDLGASTLVIGLSLLVFGVPMAVFAPFGGRLADRHGGFRVASLAIWASLPLMVLYGQLTSVALLTVVIGVHAFCDGTSTPGTQVAVARVVPTDRIGAAQGLLEAVGFAVAALAALGAAPLYAALGPAWLFTLGAAAMAALLLVAESRWRAAGRAPVVGLPAPLVGPPPAAPAGGLAP